MTHPHQHNSPQSRDRANTLLRRLTRTAVLAATGATAVIGIVCSTNRCVVSRKIRWSSLRSGFKDLAS